MANVLVIYFSAYGHIHRMAEAAAKGAADEGHAVRLSRIPEFRSPDNVTALLDHPSRRKERAGGGDDEGDGDGNGGGGNGDGGLAGAFRIGPDGRSTRRPNGSSRAFRKRRRTI